MGIKAAENNRARSKPMSSVRLIAVALISLNFVPSIAKSLEPEYRLFGSKTTFLDAYKQFTSYYNVSSVDVRGEPVMFYYFGRHSIRYPSSEQILWMKVRLPRLLRDIIAAHHCGNGTLSSGQIEGLKKWKPRMNCEDEKLVTQSGRDETAEIAKMYFKKFPSLLTASKVDMKVGVTNKVRTRETAEAFLNGLKEGQPSK